MNIMYHKSKLSQSAISRMKLHFRPLCAEISEDDHNSWFAEKTRTAYVPMFMALLSFVALIAFVAWLCIFY